MRLLILCGQIFPSESNNSKLLSKLLPYLQRGNVLRLAATSASGTVSMDLPQTYCGIPVTWIPTERRNGVGGFLDSAFAKLTDPKGFSDAILMGQYSRVIKAVRREWQFSAVLSVTEPFPAAAAGTSVLNGVKSAVYIMDPPPTVRGLRDTAFRNRFFQRILKRYDVIVSTPFFREALLLNGFASFAEKTIPLGFPMVTDTLCIESCPRSSERVHLLFTGWMCSGIRSPKYFLEILSRLDERFVVTFMGRECEKLTERFDVQTKAELITLPQQPYETALQAMADADIMINIGNSVPVHMPSKTLEYINTGKPFVNFYKMDDCPTLYYTKRYPLCLNLSEQDPDLDAAAARFVDFCLSNKGKTVDRAYIGSEYADCTPEYIANQILRALESE